MAVVTQPLPTDTLTLSHTQIVAVMIGLMLGTFLAALDGSILGTALPRIAASLRGSQDVSWAVSIYFLTSAAVTPIYGKLADLFGRRRMLNIAITLFVLGSVLCGSCQSMIQLIVFRALQGLGGGGLIVMSLVIAADIIAPRERGRYQGYFSLAWFTAGAFGPVLGGFLADHGGWRFVFWINLPLGIAVLAACYFSLRILRPKRRRPRIDYLGAVLVFLSVGGLILVTTIGGKQLAWASPSLIAMEVTIAVLTVLAIWHERRAAEPIVPLRLFADRHFRFCVLATSLGAVGMFGNVLYAPIYLQMLYGLSPGDSGLYVSPFMVIWPVTALLSARLVTRTGHYKALIVTGLVLVSVSCLALSMMTPAIPVWVVVAIFTVIGFGGGMHGPVLTIAIQNGLEFADLGTGTGASTLFRSIGQAFGVTLFGALLTTRLNHTLETLPGYRDAGSAAGVQLIHAGSNAIGGAPPELRDTVTAAILSGFQDMFLAGAIVMALAALMGLILRELPLRTSVVTANDAIVAPLVE